MAYFLVSPQLRPWRLAGITHLLTDTQTASKLQEEYLKGIRPALSDCAVTPQRGTAQKRAVSPQTPNPTGADKKTAAKAAPLEAARSKSLPQIWQAQLERTMRHPLAVWTYAELGADLARQSGEEGTKRGAFLRDMFKSLDFAPGSHALWPLGLPAPEPEYFLAGARLLNPRAVFLLGTETAAILDAGFDQPLFSGNDETPRQSTRQGLRFVLLPNIQRLSAETPQKKERILAFIRSLLGN